MDKDQARIIADEALYQLMRAKVEFPGAYEWMATEMDADDEEIRQACIRLFPEEAKKYGW